ncbi:MAG: hypothetical protein ACK41F_06000 [Fimbriimonadaceae bacterium]
MTPRKTRASHPTGLSSCLVAHTARTLAPADDLGQPDRWANRALGAETIVWPGQGTAERLRNAIQPPSGMGIPDPAETERLAQEHLAWWRRSGRPLSGRELRSAVLRLLSR